MPAISVAKALKLKNRLAGRLNEVQETIQTYNSTLAEQHNKDVDVPALVKDRNEIEECLVRLKATLLAANNPIHESIVRQGELKSRIEWLKSLPTMDGVQRHGYQNTEIKYLAFMKKKDVDEQVRLAQRDIDAIQDKLDEFNHSTKLEIPQRALDLAS